MWFKHGATRLVLSALFLCMCGFASGEKLDLQEYAESVAMQDLETGVGVLPLVRERIEVARWADQDQEDRDMLHLAFSSQATLLCRTGYRIEGHDDVGEACIGAYYDAFDAQDYSRAMLYASLACEAYSKATGCRLAANLPLRMGDDNVPVPSAMGETLKHLTHVTCSSTQPLVDGVGVDVRARECLHLARRFILATDPEYQAALEATARAFFESIYEPQRATLMYAAACLKWPGSFGCEAHRELLSRLSAPVALREVKR